MGAIDQITITLPRDVLQAACDELESLAAGLGGDVSIEVDDAIARFKLALSGDEL